MERDIAKELYGLPLGKKVYFDSHSAWLRVPGGWVYGDMQGITFIPYHDEFHPVEEWGK